MPDDGIGMRAREHTAMQVVISTTFVHIHHALWICLVLAGHIGFGW